ncbi:MAG: hypothetical protein RR931_05335, partial [Mucinivorans sp.]
VFFGSPHNNVEYIAQRGMILGILEQWFGYYRMPLLSYVAQPPLGATLSLEVQSVDNELYSLASYKTFEGYRYLVIQPLGKKMILTEGILPTNIDASIMVQSQQVLSIIGQILNTEGMSINSIHRQWNYIELITKQTSGKQNYQEFNDARSAFYSASDWASGYPAATGIGTNCGGIMVEIDAAQLSVNDLVVALDNELQVAAHAYSTDVLLGEKSCKTTPKFERAKAVVYGSSFGHKEAKIYISGTAAIRGEESLTDVGIERQTKITLENIEFLISIQNLKRAGVELPRGGRIELFRVYLKHAEHYDVVHAIIAKAYPTVPALYVVTDVCRDELLIEIEGTAVAN